MPAVSVLVKPASGNCNMHCDYCFYCDESSKREKSSYGMMTPETLKNVIRRTVMRADNGYSIAFQGGEPTLCGLDFYRTAVRYVEQYNRKNVPVSYALQTNGYAIDEDWAVFFKEHGFLIGVSVDGTERIHNGYRHGNDGGNSYEHALKTTMLLERFGVDYNILTVVHAKTAENIRSIYTDYKNRGWDYLQFIACLDPLNEPRGKKEYSLTPQRYGRFLIDLFDMWYDDLQRGKAPYIRQFDNYLQILEGIRPESCEQTGICGVQYVAEADGSVYPCDFYVLDEYRLGNFNDDLLPAIDAARKHSAFVEESRIKPDECLQCRWYSLCRGGCRRCRFTAHEKAADPAVTEGMNYFCDGYRMFFEACGERLFEIAGKNRSGK